MSFAAGQLAVLPTAHFDRNEWHVISGTGHYSEAASPDPALLPLRPYYPDISRV